MTEFVSLHNQTDYSILDSIISVKDLFNRAKELGQPAVAVTDHGTISGAWDSLKAYKETGVKLIIGCEFYFLDDTSIEKTEKFRHVILLAKNAVGYRNLLTLNRRGFDSNIFVGKRIFSVIDWKLLEKYSEGLICITACGSGIISQQLMLGKNEEAEKTLLKLKDLFGDNLGLEVQPNRMQRGANFHNEAINQTFINNKLIELGKKHNVKVVPACNSHYIKKEDHEIHDALLAIGAQQSIYSNFRLKYTVPDFYLKSGDEVKAFFARNYGEEYAESICQNTIYFANLCENPEWIDPKYSNPSGRELPVFTVKDEPNYNEFLIWVKKQSENLQKLNEDKLYLRYLIEIKFDSRIKNITTENKIIYDSRIAEELEVLEFHGFSSYMLIVSDYIDWARKNGITVGDGRGSIGGSLVAFILNIHQADPIKYDLIFARFHNKQKASMPDIDVDFPTSGREKVKKYLQEKYGVDNVADISNINTITPKVYIKDIARALELGGSKESAVKLGIDVSECISTDIKTIDDAIKKSPLFVEYCKKYPEFEKYKYICGKYRSRGSHAGGILISARPLIGLAPIRKDKDGSFVIEYDKDKTEENGFVKMDILGLSTLDDIDETINLIKKSGKTLCEDYFNYDLYDKKTYDLISSGNTFGVFQLGTSGGAIDLCTRIKPKSINDISHINSLVRPSAKDMRNDFILTKNGKRKFSLLHPNLGRAFNNTFGFGLYEESLFYLAQDIAGWSLHSADRLRKLTKEKGKNPKKAEQWRLEFITDSVKNNIDENIATRIWDEIISNFQGYGFNSSHSILYSMISFKTAYLKAHYPIEFLLANLMAETKSNSPKAKDNIKKIKNEIRANNVKITPPDINKSEFEYILEDNGSKLITGLDALKFVGDDAIKDIIEKRPFKDFFDFMVRVDSRKVRANNIQALVGSGAMDSFNIPRKLLFLYVSDYRKKLQVWLKKHDPSKETFNYPWPNEPEWSVPELYALEMYYLNEGFICKPSEAYGKFFNGDYSLYDDIKNLKNKSSISSMKAIVKSFFEPKVKKETSKYYGQSMGKLVLEDKNGNQFSATVFSDKWQNVKNNIKLVKKGAEFDAGVALHFSGSVSIYEDNVGVIIDDIYSSALPPALPADLKAKKINLKETKMSEIKVEQTVDNFFENIEDDLYELGMIDFEDEILN